LPSGTVLARRARALPSRTSLSSGPILTRRASLTTSRIALARCALAASRLSPSFRLLSAPGTPSHRRRNHGCRQQTRQHLFPVFPHGLPPFLL